MVAKKRIESLCSTCIHCLNYNESSGNIKIKSNGNESEWAVIMGSHCSLTNCFLEKVTECEGYEEKVVVKEEPIFNKDLIASPPSSDKGLDGDLVLKIIAMSKVDKVDIKDILK